MSASGDNSRALIRYALAGVSVTIVLLWAMYIARDALLLVYMGALTAIGLGPLVSAVQKRGGLLTRGTVKVLETFWRRAGGRRNDQ